jgi:hypothetical protein
VRNAAAVSLGYLTFNKTASRILFSLCRNTPGLYRSLFDNIGVDPRISQQFVKEFERAKMIGLPSQWYVFKIVNSLKTHLFKIKLGLHAISLYYRGFFGECV